MLSHNSIFSQKFFEEEKPKNKQFYQSYKQLREKLQKHLQSKNEGLKLSLSNFYFLTYQIFGKLIIIQFFQTLILSQKKFDFKDLINSKSGNKDTFWLTLLSVFSSFETAHQHFNSELFKPVPIFAKITIENEILREILSFLLAYDFKNELKVDILGHIFEQSINDIAAAKAADQEATLSVARKKDGVFYTPEFVTDYMIRGTVIAYLNKQKLLIFSKLNIDFISEFEIDFMRWQQEDPMLTRKKASEIYAIYFTDYQKILENIKVLDPACGSGAFLTRTYDILLKEWEIVYDENKKSAENLYENFVNEEVAKEKVSTKNKKTSNIDMFGMAEIAKKKRSKDLFQIGKNILLNNLFGVDLNGEAVEITKLSLWLKTANNQNVTLANLEKNIKQGNSLIEDKGIDENAFVWEKEFPEIFSGQAQGFDVVIGNPPYVAKTKNSIYKSYAWNTDLYLMFFEKSFKSLLKKDGILGFITPRFWLVNQNCKDFRQFMLTEIEMTNLVETAPFEDASTECTIVICNNKKTAEDEVLVFENIKEDFFYVNTISKNYALTNPYFEILTHLNKEKINLLHQIEKNTVLLKDITQSKRGMEIGKAELRNQVGVPTLIGQDTKSYHIDFEQTFVNINEQEYLRLKVFFNETDLYLRRVANKLIAATANEKYAFSKNIYGLKITNPNFDKYYLLALLNSKLLDFYYKNKFSTKKIDLFPEIQTYLFEALPIKNISPQAQETFVNKVQEILKLNLPNDTLLFQSIDNEIDKLIYNLYELTEGDINIIEK